MADYYDTILSVLQGKQHGLDAIPAGRLDWEAPSVLLEMYGKAAGKNRTDFIHAIGKILENQACTPGALAQLVDIASSLDLAEVEPEIRGLERSRLAAQEPLRNAITNYLAYRQLQTSSLNFARPAGSA